MKGGELETSSSLNINDLIRTLGKITDRRLHDHGQDKHHFPCFICLDVSLFCISSSSFLPAVHLLLSAPWLLWIWLPLLFLQNMHKFQSTLYILSHISSNFFLASYFKLLIGIPLLLKFTLNFAWIHHSQQIRFQGFKSAWEWCLASIWRGFAFHHAWHWSVASCVPSEDDSLFLYDSYKHCFNCWPWCKWVHQRTKTLRLPC